MINLNQTDIQKRIEQLATNYLGFNSETKYFSEKSVYGKYLSEEEVKNTEKGLQTHLAEMNFDRDLRKCFDYGKKGFFGRFCRNIGYARILIRNDRLKDKAVKEVINKRGGLINMITQHTLIRENVINYFLVFK